MLAIEEKKLEVQMHEVNLLKGEQLSSAYYALNPACDVPVLVHDGAVITDSVTILRYMDKIFPEHMLSPVEPEEEVQMEILLTLASESHMRAVVPWLYAKGYGRLPTPEQMAFYNQYISHRAQFHNDRLAGKIATSVAATQAVLEGDFQKLDTLLEKNNYLTGDMFTLADIAWFPNVYILGRIFAFPLAQYPNLQRWMEEIEARPAFQAGIKTYMKPIPSWVIRLICLAIRFTGERK